MINETLPNVHFMFPVKRDPNERATVFGGSPVAQRMIGTSELRCKRAGYSTPTQLRQPRPYRYSMFRPRLRDPDSKSRGAWRELCPEGISDRPDRSRWRRGQLRAKSPRAGIETGRPKHDPLRTGSLAAGETAGPRYGQGSYPKLESLSSDPRPLSREAGGEGSGKRTYGGSR